MDAGLFAQFVTGLGRNIGHARQEAVQSFSRRAGRPLSQERGGRLDGAHLLGDGGGNPLVQGHPVLASEPGGGILDEDGEFQGVGRFAHVANPRLKSTGRSAGTPNLAAAAKSRMLRVTSASDLPFTAASRTSSSAGSVSRGRPR
jgi:hypothetical protein